MRGHVRRAWAAVFVLGVLIGFSTAQARHQAATEASHPTTWNGGLDFHMGSVHGGNYEDWCFEVGGANWGQPTNPYDPDGPQDYISVSPPITSASTTTWRDKVDDSLKFPSAPGIDWHSIASGRIFFYLQDASTNCVNLSGTVRNRIDVEFWLFGPNDLDISSQADACSTTWDAGEPRRPTIPACAIPLYIYDNLSGSTPHSDFDYYRIAVNYSFVTGSDAEHDEQDRYRNNINHEVGHALGLQHCLGGSGEPCNRDSIMHTADGNFWTHPSAPDRAGATGVANRAPCPDDPC